MIVLVTGATAGFGRAIARADLFGTKVRTKGIEPGQVGGTEFPSVRFKGDDAESAGVYAGTGPRMLEDTADAVHWVATRPVRVTVNLLRVMPAAVRSFGPLREHRPA